MKWNRSSCTLSVPHFEWRRLKGFLPQILAWGACYVTCQKKTFKIKYAAEGSVPNVDLGLFWPNNQYCIGNSERSTVYNTLIIPLANFAIANLEQVIVPIPVQGLVHTFLTKCHSRKHWNNLFWLVYDNNKIELYWKHIFLQAHVGFLWRFWLQPHIFPMNRKKNLFSF